MQFNYIYWKYLKLFTLDYVTNLLKELENLVKRNLGAICHSLCITTSNKILKLYVSNKTPSENLLVLTSFTLKVYANVV